MGNLPYGIDKTIQSKVLKTANAPGRRETFPVSLHYAQGDANRAGAMIDSLLNLVFRCRHRRLTRPLSRVSRPGEPRGKTYVVCLDCGKHFEYDTETMRLGKAVDPNRAGGVG